MRHGIGTVALVLVLAVALGLPLPAAAATAPDRADLLTDTELASLMGLMGVGSADCAGWVIGVSLSMVLLGAATGGAGWLLVGAYAPVLVTLC